MMVSTEIRAQKAWKNLRDQGGSIFDHRGRNLTGSAGGWSTFHGYVSRLCGGDEGMSADLLKAIEEATKKAKEMERMNKLRFTSPKCYSRPEVHLKVGCSVTWRMTPRHDGEEEDCTDGS